MFELKSAPSVTRALALFVALFPALPAALASTMQPKNHTPYPPVAFQAPPEDMRDDISSKDSPYMQTSTLLRHMIGSAETFFRQAAAEAAKSETKQGKPANPALSHALDRQEAAFVAFQKAVEATTIGSIVTVIYHPEAGSLDKRIKALSEAAEAAYQIGVGARLNDSDNPIIDAAVIRLSEDFKTNLANPASIALRQLPRPSGDQAAARYSGSR